MKVFLLVLMLSATCQSNAYPRVQVDTLIDFTEADSAALFKEIKILTSILESDLFWTKILEANFGCTDWRRLHHFRKRKAEYPRLKMDRHHYSNQEIYDLLWYGDDEMGQPKDGVINLKLKAKDYEQNKKGRTKHGGTNKNTLVISSDRKTRIHSSVPGQYACHLIHEYMHVLGFKHPKDLPSKTEKKCGAKDVPLSVQLIAAEIINH